MPQQLLNEPDADLVYQRATWMPVGLEAENRPMNQPLSPSCSENDLLNPLRHEYFLWSDPEVTNEDSRTSNLTATLHMIAPVLSFYLDGNCRCGRHECLCCSA